MVALTHTRGRGKGKSLYGAVDQVGYEDRESERLKGNERESVRFTSKCLRPCASLSNCCASFFFFAATAAHCAPPRLARPGSSDKKQPILFCSRGFPVQPRPQWLDERAHLQFTCARKTFPFFLFVLCVRRMILYRPVP